MLKTAHGLVERYDRPSHNPATAATRPFDVREYTQGVRELSTTLGQMNDVIRSSDELLASPQWGSRVEQVNRAADGRIAVASVQGQLVVDGFFRRLYVALGAFFVMLIVYQLIMVRIRRRMRVSVVETGPAGGNGDGVHASAAAQRAPLKGVSG
jgi:hypothetical protein